MPELTRLHRALLAAGLLAAAPLAAAGPVVISQVYGGGGNTYKNDFVELFNAGSAPANVGGWSVQYASASGTGNFSGNGVAVLPSLTLQPGQYLLVQLAAGSAGTALPTADASGGNNLSASSGKVILANVGTGLACNGGSTPCSAAQLAQIEDLVGYGAANFYEGTAAPAAASTTALLRKSGGCTDTNANGADFETGAPAPRNTASPVNACGGTPVNQPIAASCPALNLDAGIGGSGAVSASDPDSTVTGIAPNGALPAGISLGSVVPAAADGGTASALVSVDAGVAAGTYAVPLVFTNDDAQSQTCSVAVTVQAAAAVTPISALQGSGAASPLAGQTVTTEGVVTAVFPGLNGFYLQDPAGDGDAATSDGVFVYLPGVAGIAAGQKLRLTAAVSEYYGITELTTVSNVQVLGTGIAVAPTDIALPEASEGDLERVEGMLVRVVSPLTVSQNYFQGRYGQVTLAADGRLEIPTNRHRPGSAEALALKDENARRRIVLDDGSSAQNPNPIPFIGADDTLRAGDTVENLVGVVDYGLVTSSATGPSDYKLQPVGTPAFVRAHPRTAAPEPVGGNVRVASFNVLNYFTTIDQTGAACFPGGGRSDCRGADSAAEFTRQQAKIVAAIKAIDADALGLMEIENNGNTAVQNLVDALNAAYGSPVYATVGLPTGGTGGDAIRVAMIYKPAKLTPVGAALSDTDPTHHRPPLAQTFMAANGEKFSLVVNHFKSKGCGDAAGADADQGDGQGCYNSRRQAQAAALNTFIGQLAAQSGDPDVLAIGDLNSYGMEDPIVALTDAGLVNLIAAKVAQPYSYTFDGESGYLDHALATAGLGAQVSGVAEWHINADEPAIIDYNTEFKPQDLYAATPYRSSDHDPVVVGLDLLKPIDGTAGRDTLTGTSGDDAITGAEGADTLTGGAGRDVFVYRGLRDGNDTLTDFTPAVDRLDLRQLLAAIGYAGANPLADGVVRLIATAAGISLQIDADGAGPGAPRPLATLKNVAPAQLDAGRDFLF